MNEMSEEVTPKTLGKLPREILEFLLEVLKRKERQNPNETVNQNNND